MHFLYHIMLYMTHSSFNLFRTLDKTISSLEMQLAAARAAKVNDEDGSPTVTNSGSARLKDRQKVFFVMGIITAFSSRKRRESIRETWMPQGSVNNLIAIPSDITLNRCGSKLIAQTLLLSFNFRRGTKEVGNRERNYNTVCDRTQVIFLESMRKFVSHIYLLYLVILTNYPGLNLVAFSATPGGVLDRAIDAEDEQHKDFLRLVW